MSLLAASDVCCTSSAEPALYTFLALLQAGAHSWTISASQQHSPLISPAGSPTKQNMGLGPQPRREAQAAMSFSAASAEQRAVQQASESFLDQVEAARRSYAFEIEQLRVSCQGLNVHTAQSVATSQRLLSEALCMALCSSILNVVLVLQQACNACKSEAQRQLGGRHWCSAA